MKKIGFIGLGVMGSSMAGHLLDAGYEVVVYNRTKAKAEEVISKGATWADTPKEVAAATDVVITIVGYPKDVEEVYFGETGIFNGAKEGTYLVDMTTSTPTLAIKIAEKAQELKMHALDAPVSGGDKGAREATLTIMVGGTEADFETLLPIFEVMGKKIMLQGKPGSGQHTKMANQIMIAGTMTGLTELLVYAKAAGLDPSKAIEQIGAGSAANWSLENYGPRVLKGDFEPGFYSKHFLKDLRIALEEAKKLGINLPATEKAEQLYAQLAEAGFEDKGTQALIKIYQ